MVDPNTFSGARIDRAGARRRDDAWFAGKLHDPASRALALTREGVLVRDPGDAPQLAELPLDELPGGVGGTGSAVLLGVRPDGSALFGVDVDRVHGARRPLGPLARHPRRPLAPGTRVLGLREAGALLAQDVGGLVAYAAALLNWHRTHPHCAQCGAVTDVVEGGHTRTCPVCGAEHHPRTDPVVIMLVTDGERLLLGRQASWPARRWSALAGFVEPGESLEEAVAREVLEESGVEVGDVRYVSSQPWPFPSSLMLGFVAEWAGGEPEVRDGELEDVRWFTRAEVAGAAETAATAGDASWEAPPDGEGLLLPPPLAIARRLVDGWLVETAR